MTYINSAAESHADIYDRQIRSWGYDNQQKLFNASVLVLGSDFTAQYTLGSLVGLGIGNIYALDNTTPADNFLSNGSPKKGLESSCQTISRINPGINIRGRNSRLSQSLLSYDSFRPDVIIETTNDSWQKEAALDYVFKNPDVKLVSTYSGSDALTVSTFDLGKGNVREILDDTGVFSRFRTQHPITSGIAAAIASDEARKYIFSREQSDKPLEERVIYNLRSDNRKTLSMDNAYSSFFKEDTKILVAGAGSLGTYVSLALGLKGFQRIDILDMDTIENVNLNRQILYYDAVGQPKAETLSNRINQLTKGNSRHIQGKIDISSNDIFENAGYNMIFGCFDNQNARYYLAAFAREFEIPYVDGGTNDTSGNVRIYIPGKTNCMTCKKGLSVKKEKKQSCTDAEPSVITPNMVIANAMVGEGLAILGGSNQDIRISYDSNEPLRISTKPEQRTKTPCGC